MGQRECEKSRVAANTNKDTTRSFSGAAWAITKRPDEIHVITDWDSEYNTCSDRGKCPTHLEYGTVDHETPWGYNIPPHKDILRWFKLLLLEENDVADELAQSAQFKQAITLQSRLKKSPVELVSCFLRSLWEHCINSITGVLGSNEVDSCKISIIMTVPAMWPHYVQARMRTAADQAGMLRLRTTDAGTYTPALHFVSEPEAAALAVLAEMHPRPDIKVVVPKFLLVKEIVQLFFTAKRHDYYMRCWWWHCSEFQYIHCSESY